MSINATYTYLNTRQQVIIDLDERAQTSLESLNTNLSGLIASYAINDYKQLIATETAKPHVSAVLVEDNNFAEIIGVSTYLSGKIKNEKGIVEDFDNKKASMLEQLQQAYASPSIDITSHSGKLLGKVTLYLSDAVLDERLNLLIKETLLSTVFITIILITLLFISIRLFVLRHLSTIVDSLSMVDNKGLPLQPLNANGPREIQLLSASINHMISDITSSRNILQQQHEELDKLNESLELRVRQRTTELRKARDEANNANQAKSMFLANMSHELRTPMHAIISFTSLALKREQDQKNLHFLENIKVSSERLTQLLNSLPDLSKLEAGKMQAEFATHDLGKILSKTIAQLESLLKPKNLKILFDEQTSLQAYVDENLYAQVAVNLIANAIKFSPEQGEISIRLIRSSIESDEAPVDAVTLIITDNGMGIPDDQIDLIFEQFVQSDRTYSNSGGTGLGLAISKQIVQLHNGLIWAESPPRGKQRGTALQVEIPISQPKLQEPE